MKIKASLVCEGGGMRGVYTSGILDRLMEEKIEFSHAVGVSAGSCNVASYAASQIGRAKKCFIINDKSLEYMGLKCLLKKHTFYDYDLCFDGFAESHFPYDYEAFNNSYTKVEVVVTDCETGEAEYVKAYSKEKQIIKACRASSTLPYITKIYDFEGHHCLDGGIADSIPIKRALEYGNERIVVILTKPYGYKKTPYHAVNRFIIRCMYSKYPRLIETLLERYRVYNQATELVDRLEAEGKIFVFRPSGMLCSRNEKDNEKLEKLYEMGRADADNRIQELLAYLKEKEHGKV